MRLLGFSSMKSTICSVSLLAMAVFGSGSLCLNAQNSFVSPEVHADRTVTFRLRAPKASDVLVTGLAGQGRQVMTQGCSSVSNWANVGIKLTRPFFRIVAREFPDVLHPKARHGVETIDFPCAAAPSMRNNPCQNAQCPAGVADPGFL